MQGWGGGGLQNFLHDPWNDVIKYGSSTSKNCERFVTKATQQYNFQVTKTGLVIPIYVAKTKKYQMGRIHAILYCSMYILRPMSMMEICF